MTTRIPITIFNGFLGAGKTTIILNLLHQLDVDQVSTQSSDDNTLLGDNSTTQQDGQDVVGETGKKYSVVWIKNEFGVNEVDSILAQQSSITSVKEITNGCLCCTLVGRLSDSLYEILIDNSIRCDRIIIETSGSAFPTSLIQEINRVSFFNENNPRILLDNTPHLADGGNDSNSPETAALNQVDEKQWTEKETSSKDNRPSLPVFIDGVICVVDALNYYEYSDTSFTAKIQAKYTDLILLNKHELIGAGGGGTKDGEDGTPQNQSEADLGEQQKKQLETIDNLKDLLMELNPETPIVKTDHGWINYEVVFGLDSAMWNQQQQQHQTAATASDQHAPSGLSDVDVVHVEWITQLVDESHHHHEHQQDQTAQFVPIPTTTALALNPITLPKFEKLLIQLHLFNCLRAKGVVLLQMTLAQYQIIEETTRALKIKDQTFHSTNLLSSMATSAATTAVDSTNQLFSPTSLITIPVILNWALGRWSIYPIPNFTPIFKAIDGEGDSPQLITTNLPPIITSPSSLYTNPTHHSSSSSSSSALRAHSRLTLFGAAGSISTFSFQKMVTRHLPVSIRKDCCQPTTSSQLETHTTAKSTNHVHSTQCSSSGCAATSKADPHHGGFITVLSKDHSHNHHS